MSAQMAWSSGEQLPVPGDGTVCVSGRSQGLSETLVPFCLNLGKLSEI